MFFLKRIFFFLSIVICLTALVPPECVLGTSPPKGPSNILLVTIDTLRPDHIGCYGYASVKTPAIDAVAKNGVLFTNAYTPVPLTLPSHTSIMTGKYPIQHGIQNNGTYVLGDSAETLAEILHERGYRTGAIVASYVLAIHFGLNQGFDDYKDCSISEDGKAPNLNQFRMGNEITDIAKGWLRENGGKPFFLWVHYFDPHVPYDPPSPFDQQYKGAPYDGEIAYTDQCLGGLFDEMQRLSLLENTCIILVGDHGESLSEHDELTHGLFIYDTTLRVPLIISNPGNFEKGMRISSLVRTIDIMPTVMETLGITSEKVHCEGKSLAPLMKGEEKCPDADIYCESLYPEFNFDCAPLEGIITTGGWKYINAPRPELYNLANDPHEKTNLFSKDPNRAASFKARLVDLKEALLGKSRPEADSKQIALSTEAREKLRSLGYIWSSEPAEGSSGDHACQSLPDPKDMASQYMKIEKAQDHETRGEFDKAIELYAEVIKENPKNKMALFKSGMAYVMMGRHEEAFAMLKKAITLAPRNLDCLYTIGMVYYQFAMPEQAIEFFKKAIDVNPGIAYIHNSLGMVYMKMNNLDLAVGEFEKAMSASTDPILISVALGNIGGIVMRRGDAKEALEKFKESINHNPMNHDAHVSLADTYYELGGIQQSIDEWKRIIEVWPDDYPAYYKMAQLYLKSDKRGEAVQYLQRCIRLCPDYLDARVLLQQIT